MPLVELVHCAECAAPAEVVDRFALESTGGPVEHAIVVCVLRHRRTVLVERLQRMAEESAGASTRSSARAEAPN
jgi:hypothetical protein